MVWFTFTFLLGIPDISPIKLEGISKEKEKKIDVEKNFTEIEVSKPNFTCHIEYVLLPNKEPKTIDVVCWDRAAKIYSEHSNCAMMPLVSGRLRWIHFRVNNKVTLENEDVPIFHMHKMNFSITLDSKKLGEAAKSDKISKFYGPKFRKGDNEHMIRKQYFQPLSETLEDLQSVSFYKGHLTSHQQLFIELDTTIETSENCSKLYKTMMHLTKEYHDENFVGKPAPPHQDLPPLKSIFKQDLNEKTKEKEKNSLKKTDPVGEKIEFSITGEEFLSGKKIFENCLKYNLKELPFIYSLVSVKNLLTRAQAAFFNPLSITISNFNYLPAHELANNGITKLKLEYLICNEFLAESNLMPISKRMKLNYTRTILTNEMDINQLIYFIQTCGLKIDIVGNSSKHTQLEENLHAKSRPFDLKSNQSLDKNEFILLGRLLVDISAILFQPHKLLLKCNFQFSPDNFFSCKKKTGNDFTTVNEFNFSCTRKKALNFDCIPSLTGPMLSISVRLGHPLTNAQQTVAINPNLYNRLFVVLYSINLAIQILKRIQGEIPEFLEPVDYVNNGKNARPLTKKNFSNLYNLQCSKKNQITGFAVDCIDKILIYVESSVFGGIQQVWALASNINPSQGHVLFDSSLIFCDRLYEIFFKFGGFFPLTLRETPEIMLSKCGNYRNKNIPEPAWKALQCLDLLAKCKSMKAATQNNLFPNPDALCSLAMEFGVPVQICEKTENFM